VLAAGQSNAHGGGGELLMLIGLQATIAVLL